MLRHVLSALFVVCVLSTVATAEDYEVKFFRKAKINDVYELSGEVKQDMKMTMIMAGQERPGQSKSSHYKFDYLEKTVGVDQFGNATELHIVIRKLHSVTGGQESELATSGTVAIVKLDAGKTSVTPGKEDTLTAAAKEAISEITQLKSEEPKDDKIMGPDGKKSPGDSWPINKKAVAETIPQGQGVKLDPDKIEGTVKFLEMAEKDGQSCLKMKVDVDMSKAIEGIQGVPPEAKIKSAKMTMEGTGLLPVDTAIQKLQENLTMKSTINMQVSQQGFEITMRMNQTMMRNIERTKME